MFVLLAEDQQGSPFGSLMVPMIAIGFLWYFLLFRPQRREKSKRDTLLKALKKNDRVVTIGGIIGSIANVTQDGKEVTLKVDDNTRIKMLRSSIQTVLRDEKQDDAGEKTTASKS